MQEPIAWMVTNMEGQDAYVTADPTLAASAQRALPLYTAPVMDTCAEVRASSPTSGGGFVERELAVARGLASCRGDEERLAEAEQEIAALRSELDRVKRYAAVAMSVKVSTHDEMQHDGRWLARWEVVAKFAAPDAAFALADTLRGPTVDAALTATVTGTRRWRATMTDKHAGVGPVHHDVRPVLRDAGALICHRAGAQVCLMEDAQKYADERVAAERERLRSDAETWGDALNEAGWAATEAYRRHTGQVEPPIFFNHAKGILRDALAAYFKALGA
ncbi:MAG TPA: hypothetical protein PLF37_14460 [Planctomycetota bacterium]|nr:hypothetical protein [Planctomycetota bacterium]